MGELNTLTGALSLAIVAMSIVFGVLASLALMMVLIKHVASLIERSRMGVREPSLREGALREGPSPVVEEPIPLRGHDDGEIAAIAAAIAAISSSIGKPVRVWNIKGPVKSLWKESARIENMIGGNGNE
ncbi:MAG: OadG family protein [Synergistetes bacterium]|nr:OadG family protein [Synergistota bacterium]